MLVQSSEELLEEYESAIRAVVFEVRKALGVVIDEDELFDLGVEGLLEAAPRFDPAHGVKLWTFAYTRVRGRMIDAIRARMRVPLCFHRRLARAHAALRQTAVGTREHEEAARRVEDVQDAISQLSPEALAIVRGETLGVEDSEPVDAALVEYDGPPLGSCSADDGSALVMRVDRDGADEQLDTARRAAAIHAAMRQLSVVERMVVRGLYFEERGLLDIGEELGISKSWACRIHTRALRRLEELLADDWGYVADSERTPRAPKPREEPSIAPVSWSEEDDGDDFEDFMDDVAA